MEDVAAACERVIVIAKGELVFDGGTEELAHRATAKVWEVRTQQGVKPIIPTQSIRTHETPSADGKTVHRILTSDYLDDAEPVEATLEDGYIWLLSHTDTRT